MSIYREQRVGVYHHNFTLSFILHPRPSAPPTLPPPPSPPPPSCSLLIVVSSLGLSAVFSRDVRTVHFCCHAADFVHGPFAILRLFGRKYSISFKTQRFRPTLFASLKCCCAAGILDGTFNILRRNRWFFFSSLWGPLAVSWATPWGSLWGFLGVTWGPFGLPLSLLAFLWALLGSPWGPFVDSWRLFGLPRGPFGVTWGPFGFPFVSVGSLWGRFGVFCSRLGASCALFGLLGVP